MLNSGKYSRFLAAIALQAVIILSVVAFKLAVLGGGTEVLLSIHPADPRDPLRGDYIVFAYDISSVNFFGGDQVVRNGDTVFVTLRQSGIYWVVKAAQTTKPKGNEIFIKGVVKSGATPQFNSNSRVAVPALPVNQKLTVEYGIEQYFIPEGSGRNMGFTGSNNAAKVVIDENGNAVLKGILMNGTPWP